MKYDRVVDIFLSLINQKQFNNKQTCSGIYLFPNHDQQINKPQHGYWAPSYSRHGLVWFAEVLGIITYRAISWRLTRQLPISLAGHQWKIPVESYSYLIWSEWPPNPKSISSWDCNEEGSLVLNGLMLMHWLIKPWSGRFPGWKGLSTFLPGTTGAGGCRPLRDRLLSYSLLLLECGDLLLEDENCS